ncbi:MucR family transcriptional regulator [Candidatus Entotheonella palauensis]|uniref:MucR family transcriptional regulator n=1 Tax=Candidatus Entotheonella gemina TaxID=1429439 RepID=W4M1N2_9BACT|nr:MucR family transcriptional regulator [Candidatus Entotheonella palauensis]ETX03836.1 MAG: hypothetical protein ETSY2_32275 [Candidatus Entotheonella gemina]
MAKELVAEYIRVHHLSPDDANALLLSTHDTLLSLHHTEMLRSVPTLEADEKGVAPDWKRSIAKYAVTCLECGATFRQLSARHLRVHDLDSRSYRAKYGIPRTQPLSSRQATARRRELAQQIRPWEQAASRRVADQPETKTNAKISRVGQTLRGRPSAKRSETV